MIANPSSFFSGYSEKRRVNINLRRSELAVSNAEAEDDRQSRELMLVNRIVDAVVAESSPEILLELLCRELALAFELPYAIAVLLNEKKTHGVVAAEYRHNRQPSVLKRMISLEKDFLGQYFNGAKKLLIVENFQDVPLHDPFFELLQYYKSGRFFVFPLVVEDEAIAWVILGDVAFHHFPANDISLIERVANLTASALAKFRLKKEWQQLEGLYYQAQKMAMVGQLSVNVTRDFSNLLTAINGYAWVMKSELEADNPHQYLVTSILSLSRYTADLARQLLALNRQQSSKLQMLDINSVIVQMEKILEYMLGEGITLETTLMPMIWSIKAEPSQIGQIIINMAINAYDAMQGEGRLTIETSNVILDNNCKNRYLQAEPGEYVAWTISDTGAGISAEAKAHIFDPFFSTKETDRRPGFGLATVLNIIKQHKGDISVDSQKGKGTTFRIYLPRSRESML